MCLLQGNMMVQIQNLATEESSQIVKFRQSRFGAKRDENVFFLSDCL